MSIKVEENEKLEIENFFYILKKGWKIIILASALVSGIVFSYNKFLVSPLYMSSAKIFVGKEAAQGQVYTESELRFYQSLLSPYIELMQTPDFIDRAMKNNKIKMSSAEVLSNLRIGTSNQFLNISYVSTNAKESKKVLDSIINEFMVYSKEFISNGNLKIAQNSKVPRLPVSPNIPKNTIIGFIIGIVIGIGIVLVRDYLDNTFSNTEMIERELGITVVGVIPVHEKIKESRTHKKKKKEK